MNTENSISNKLFIWQIVSIHTVSYFIAGIFALLFMGYKEKFGGNVISDIMLPVDSPIVSLGAGFQVLRGLIISLVLLPFKTVLLAKNGWLKIALLFFSLSYLSTIGPTFGSFEGYIYTKIPIQYHLLGLPETILYILLFAVIFKLWNIKPRKIYATISVIFASLIVLMSVLGLLASLDVIKTP
jgi:hypothetical protein